MLLFSRCFPCFGGRLDGGVNASQLMIVGLVEYRLSRRIVGRSQICKYRKNVVTRVEFILFRDLVSAVLLRNDSIVIRYILENDPPILKTLDPQKEPENTKGLATRSDNPFHPQLYPCQLNCICVSLREVTVERRSLPLTMVIWISGPLP